MDRRTALKAVGLLPFMQILQSGPARTAVKNSQLLVATPELRFKYLDRLLRLICDDLGPHPSGSPAFEKTIRIIKDEMNQALPVTELDSYTFEKWELVAEPVFEVGGTRIETYPHHGCSGTPAGGITGILRAADGRYEIADPSSGEVKALVAVSSYGCAIPRSAGMGVPRSLPYFGIGKYDKPFLDTAVANRTAVFARAEVAFTPDCPSWNSVGTLPGKRNDEILLVAHADTVYPSPGANDNTATVITMLMLAHAFSGTEQDYTLTFLATGNEEYGTVGARHYAERRIKDGSMANIRYIVQFDSLTYGPDLLLTSTDEELRSQVETINTDLGIDGVPRHIPSDAYVMDAEPFKPSGARAIYINSRGYDGVTLPVYHRPEDTRPTVAFDCVDNAFRVFKEFIERVQKRS